VREETLIRTDSWRGKRHGGGFDLSWGKKKREETKIVVVARRDSGGGRRKRKANEQWWAERETTTCLPLASPFLPPPPFTIKSGRKIPRSSDCSGGRGDDNESILS
jgi:hypothetical protein